MQSTCWSCCASSQRGSQSRAHFQKHGPAVSQALKPAAATSAGRNLRGQGTHSPLSSSTNTSYQPLASQQATPAEALRETAPLGAIQKDFLSDAGGQEHRPSQGTRGQPQYTQGPLVLLLSSSSVRAAIREQQPPAHQAPRRSPPLPRRGCGRFTSCQYLLPLVPLAPAAALAAPGAGKRLKQTTAQRTAVPTGRADEATRGRGGMLLGGPGTAEPLQHPGCFGTGHTALAGQDSVGTLGFGQPFPPFLCLQSGRATRAWQAGKPSRGPALLSQLRLPTLFYSSRNLILCK